MSFLFGVHAPNRLLCVAYTAVLLLHLPWPEPTWFYALWIALNWPTFGPKGRPKAEQQDKEEQLRQELHDYIDAHAGQFPPTTSALYQKLRKGKLLRFLQEEKSAREERLRQAQQQDKEEQLRQELHDYIDAHAGQFPPTTSALYQKLRKGELPIVARREDRKRRAASTRTM